MGIFVTVEFGVTFSERGDAIETPETYTLISRAEANIAKSDLAQVENSTNKALSSPHLSLPWLRPLDLSGPFDEDQKDLWTSQHLNNNNLSPLSLKCQGYSNQINADLASSSATAIKARDASNLFEIGETILRAKDLGLFQQATLTVNTLLHESEKDIDHGKPWRQSFLDNNFIYRNIRFSSHFGRTLYAAHSYEICKRRITQWDNIK